MQQAVGMYVEAPTPDEAARLINSGRKLGIVIAVGVCEVFYTGRAAASLGPSRRLVILKRDGTLLVHEAEKAQPKIWNPPGSSTAAYVEGGKLVVKSIRSRPFETVRVIFDKVDFIAAFDVGATELTLVGSERDVVGALVKNPSIIEEGLEVVGVEVPTDVGHLDILARDKNGRYVIIEVKRDLATHEAVFQLARYVELYRRKGYDVRGILVAGDITASAYDYLKRYGLNFVKINPRELMVLTNKNPLNAK
ncbi:endonuclease NucS [Pyrobaculum aerophilum]|nr:MULTISPECIES: endonuclease NucS [Pyrobaculum]